MPTPTVLSTPAPQVVLRPASMTRRLFAALLDHFLIALLLPIFSSPALDLLEAFGPHIQPLIWQVLLQITFYLGAFWLCTWKWGTTPGKRLLGMWVVNVSDGQPVGAWQSFLREVPGRFCSTVLWSPVGYVSASFPGNLNRTLADEWAGTVVVRKIKQTSRSS